MLDTSPVSSQTNAMTAETAVSAQKSASPRFQLGEVIMHRATQIAALLVLVSLLAIIISLIIGAWPAITTYGFGFLTSTEWNPPRELFGAMPAIYGTLLTSAGAMLIAVPVGVMIALFLTEICPQRLRKPIGIAIELLAGVPSIVYGIWGLFVFAPFLKSSVEPLIIGSLGKLPLVGGLFAGPAYGIGIFTSALILAIMVLPFITSISRDVFNSVPPVLKEAGYGIGCTTWEVFAKIIYPYSRVGVVGACMLALGRALGETMAVTFVIGNSHKMPSSILGPGTTISATIANEFTEAEGDLYTASLIELALLLFVITLIVLTIARFMLARIEGKKA